jgi:hypothetical protein
MLSCQTSSSSQGKIRQKTLIPNGPSFRWQSTHLKPSDLAKAQSEIAADKTAVFALSGKKRGQLNITGGKTTASRCTIIFQAMMAWAVSRKILVAHPTSGEVRYKIDRRERLISLDEVQKIFEATERLEKRGEVRSEFGLIIRLLILTSRQSMADKLFPL